MMPSALTRYLALRFLSSAGMTAGGIAAFIFVINLADLFTRSAGKEDMTFGLTLVMAALKLPLIIGKVLPFIVLFGAIWMFSRLSRHHELEAIRASGVSAWQFLVPPVGVALLLGLGAMTAFNPIAASAASQFEQLEARYLRGQVSILAALPTGVWLRQADARGQAVIHALRVSSQEMRLEDVTVILYRGADVFDARIDAKSAILEDGTWRLLEANEHRGDGPPVKHETYMLPTTLTPDQVRDSFTSPDSISFWDLPRFISAAEAAGFAATRHRVHYYTLLVSPFLLAAMVVISAAFSMRPFRLGGTARLLALGAFTGFAFYFFSDFAKALGLSGLVPPLMAAVAPAAAGLLAGVTALLYLEDG